MTDLQIQLAKACDSITSQIGSGTTAQYIPALAQVDRREEWHNWRGDRYGSVLHSVKGKWLKKCPGNPNCVLSQARD